MTNILDRFRKPKKSGLSPDLPPGARLPEEESSPPPDLDPFGSAAGAASPQAAGALIYDPSQRDLLEPQLQEMGLSLPDDPDSPEFQDLLAQLRQTSPQLAAAVQGMVRDPAIDQDNEIMAAAEKTARRASAPAEKLRAIFMTTNANGEPVFNKTAAMTALLAVGGLVFAAIALTPSGSTGTPTTQEASKGAEEGTTVTNPDGSTTTTYSDGSTLTKQPDGTQIVKKPNGEELTKTPDGVLTTKYPDGHTKVMAADGTSVETLSDGSTISRDAEGKVIASTPPVIPENTSALAGTTGAAAADGTSETSGTQPAGSLDDPYASSPPAASDTYATPDPYSAPSTGSAYSSAPTPSAAETASGISDPADPFKGTPYEAGIYNPTEAELAAGYKPSGTSTSSASSPPTSAGTEPGPLLLTPTAAETAAGIAPPVASGGNAPVAGSSAPAAGTPASGTPVVVSPPPTRLTVYRVGAGQQGTEQPTGTAETAGTGTPASSSGGNQGGRPKRVASKAAARRSARRPPSPSR